MKILRDIREMTKLLILRELTSYRHSRLRTIADRLDITIQGISDYMKMMTEEGLVRNVDGTWKATTKGVEFLQSNFLSLKEFVESSTKEMSIVDVCAAIAGNDIKRGDKVGLFMVKGELIAYSNKDSSSKGVAINSVSKGYDLGVKDLEGIVQLSPGKITLLRIPSIRDGGTTRLNIRKVKKVIRDFKYDIVAAVDLIGRVLAKRLNLDVTICYSVLLATLEAAQRGYHILVLCPEDHVAQFIGGIEENNTRLEDKITYETVSLR